MRTHQLFVLAMLLPAAPAWSATCDRILGTHGFKAAAQVTCHFGQRENQGLDWARACARRQDPGLNTMEIRKGAEVFQATVERMGQAAACGSVLRDFGGVLFRR